MWLRRSSTTTRTSLAQQAARRTSLAASRSPAVIPARHHSQTRSPKSAGTVYRTTGRWPSLVWIQACAQPARTRRG